MTADAGRPGAVTAAVVSMVLGAVTLAVGGVLTAAVSFDTLRQLAPESVSDDTVRESLRFYRGEGVIFAVAAVSLLALTIRAARRDPRYRRAAVALGLALVALVSLAALVVGTDQLVTLSLLPLTIGALLFTRPSVRNWYAAMPGSADA